MGMTDDIMKERLRSSDGKVIKVLLESNGWKFKGKLTNYDDNYIEILDFVMNGYKLILISDIKTLEVYPDE